MKPFAPNKELTVNIRPLGNSGEPLLVIDDFLQNPEAAVQAAATSKDWQDLAPGGYPGRRAALPGAYAKTVLRRLDDAIRSKLFSVPMQLDRFECSFSMVTQTPTDLAHVQRVPHIDIARENRVAILHYLCSSRFGGTAFFRQLETGLEQVGPANRMRYLKARSKDLAALRPDDNFPHDDTPGYVKTTHANVQFNRVIIYRSFSLHSGIISDPDLLSVDPRKGRLTANFFVDYAPEQK